MYSRSPTLLHLHPMSLRCGRKPELPEETHGLRGSASVARTQKTSLSETAAHLHTLLKRQLSVQHHRRQPSLSGVSFNEAMCLLSLSQLVVCEWCGVSEVGKSVCRCVCALNWDGGKKKKQGGVALSNPDFTAVRCVARLHAHEFRWRLCFSLCLFTSF